MATGTDEIQRLIQTSTLAPASVPPHRTLDMSFLCHRSQPDTTSFCDMFWVQRGRLACCAVRVGGGLTGRLGAHGVKAVLRTAMHRYPADQALALGLQTFQAYGPVLPIDAAVATIAARDGSTTIGLHGSGAASCLAAGALVPVAAGTPVRLARGEGLRLSVGGIELASLATPQSTAAVDLVHAAVDEAPGSAAAAIVIKDFHEADAATFVLGNDVEEISPILGEIGAYLQRQGVDSGGWAALEVALDELLTNIVLYAYRDGGVHEILIDVRARHDALRVEIRDDGIPFDPTSVPSPDLQGGLEDRPLGGLGVHLARTIFDAIGYRRLRGWNVLALDKSLAATSA